MKLEGKKKKKKRDKPVSFIVGPLGSVVKQHGAVEGMVIQLLCSDRLLVLHLTACSANELRWAAAEVLINHHSCRLVIWRKIHTVSVSCHWKINKIVKKTKKKTTHFIYNPIIQNRDGRINLAGLILFCTILFYLFYKSRLSFKQPIIKVLSPQCDLISTH